MTLNVIQDTATIMDKKMRVRLAATRFALYGVGGIIIQPAVNEIYELLSGDDDAWFQDYPDARYIINNGMLDYGGNKLINALYYDEKDLSSVPSDIAFGEALIPYSEHRLIYADFLMELWKLFDGDENTMPRTAGTAAMGRVWKSMQDIKRIWGVQEAPTHEKLLLTMDGIGKLSSGWNNMAKAILMNATRRVETANGFDIGVEATVPEAIARAWGFRSHKEIHAFENYIDAKQLETVKKDIADNVYKDMVFIADNFGTDEAESMISQLSSIWGIVREGSDDLDSKDVDDILQMVVNKVDKQGNDGRTTILEKLLDYNGKNIQGPMKKILQRMLDSGNPKVVEWARAFEEGKM